jgi:hypothetical protein
MPGFVDVGGMTDEQVKRMGHVDELGPEDRQPRKSARGPRFTYRTLPTDLVFQAACAANRIQNGRYVKNNLEQDATGAVVTVKTNREILLEVLADPAQILDQDRDLAADVRRHYQGLQFRILAGKVLSELESKALAYASGDTISERDIGLVAYLPSGYAQAQRRSSIEERIADARGGYVGDVGTKVSCELEVLRCNYSQQWNTYFVTGITTGDQAVFFANRKSLTVGATVRATGNVKAHRDGQTQLNYVKII